MNQTKSVFYHSHVMPAFIMEQLTAGIVPAFFPVSFIYDGKSYQGVFQTESYSSLSEIEELPVKDMLNLIGMLLHVLSENEKHYISGGEYKIDLNTVYVNRNRTRIKLIYIPNTASSTIKSQLKEFILSCRNKVSEGGRIYLDNMAEYLMREEVGYYSMIHHGEQLQYEISVCGIH